MRSAKSWGSVAELLEAERTICGVTHDVLGARACERWGLPPVLTNLVRHHHHPNPLDVDPKLRKLIAVMSFVDWVMAPMSAGNIEGENTSVEELAKMAHEKAPEWLGLTEAQLGTAILAAMDAAQS